MNGLCIALILLCYATQTDAFFAPPRPRTTRPRTTRSTTRGSSKATRISSASRPPSVNPTISPLSSPLPTSQPPNLPPELTFVTGNPAKLAEARQLLASIFPPPLRDERGDSPPYPTGLNFTSVGLDFPEIQGSPYEISRAKAHRARSLHPSPTAGLFVEDTSLSFGCLNGLPGPYIKDFMAVGLDNLHRIVEAFPDKTCYAETIISYAPPGECSHPSSVVCFAGRTEGRVVKPRGGRTSGWDSIFECAEGPEGVKGKTYAEMDCREKNEVSHRGKAFRAFGEWLSRGS